MLEVLARRHYREYELHDLRALDRGPAGPFVVADYTLDERPTHLVSTIGTVAELADRRAGGLVAARRRAGRRPRPTGTQAVVDLYLRLAGRARSRRTRPRAQLRRAAGRAAVRPRRTPGRGRGVPGRRRGRSPTSPSGPARRTAIVEDDLVRGVHPMVGRRLEPVAAARLRHHPAGRARGRAALPLRRPGQRRPTSGSSRSPRSASSPSSATRTARSSSLPHAERAVANCLEAIRRARTPAGATGAKLDMNHVWVHIWPVVDAELDELDRAAAARSRR